MSPRQALELARTLRPAIADERVLAAIASIPRERFVPATAAQARLRERGAADRRRPDDLAAARGGADARDARPQADRPRARRRHRFGLPRGAAVAARRSRLHDRAPRRADRSRPARRSTSSGIDNVTFRSATAGPAGPSTRPSTRSTWPRRPATTLPRALEASWPTAGRLVAPVGFQGTAPDADRRAPGRCVSRRQLEAVQFVPLVATSEVATSGRRAARRRCPAASA